MVDTRDHHRRFLAEKRISLEESEALRIREERLKADLTVAVDARNWVEVAD